MSELMIRRRCAALAALACVWLFSSCRAVNPDATIPEKASEVIPTAAASSTPEHSGGKPLSVTMSWCSQAQCELVLTFNKPMAPKDKLSEAAVPKVVFDPPQKGTWGWLNERKLQFKPASDQLLQGWRVTASVDHATALDGSRLKKPFQRVFWVPNIEAGIKWASWPAIAGKPKLVGVFRHGRPRIGKKPVLLLFDQAVDPRGLLDAGLSAIGPDGQRFKLRAHRPENAEPFYDGDLDNRLLVALTVEGHTDVAKIDLRVPSHTTDGERVVATRTLDVVHTIRPSRITTNAGKSGMPLWGVWNVQVDSAFDPDILGKYLEITPRPTYLSIDAGDGYITATGHLEPGKTYTLDVKAGLTDLYGNVASKGARHSVRTVDLSPSILLPDNGLIVERDRPSLPVKVLNLRNIDVRAYRFAKTADFLSAVRRGSKLRCRDFGAKMVLVGRRSVRSPGKLNQRATAHIKLPTKGQPMLGCVEVSGLGIGTRASAHHDHPGLCWCRSPTWD